MAAELFTGMDGIRDSRGRMFGGGGVLNRGDGEWEVKYRVGEVFFFFYDTFDLEGFLGGRYLFLPPCILTALFHRPLSFRGAKSLRSLGGREVGVPRHV